MNSTSIFLTCFCVVFHLIKAENVDCPSEGIAYLPHSKCTEFYICLNGEVEELTCPFGLYYNPETTQCDFPENVSGCRGGTRSSITSTTISTEEPSKTTELPPAEMTECGQSIIADNGTIRYKLNESYDAGELCVFMIKFESGFLNTTFTLDTHGLIETDFAAVTILRHVAAPQFEADLGPHQRSVSFFGYRAFVIFKTNNSSGTGFQLSFKRDAIISSRVSQGTNVVFNEEKYSPLNIPYPSNYTGEIVNNFVFTMGSKTISDPDSNFRLTITAWLGDEEENVCGNRFNVYLFNSALTSEPTICMKQNDGRLFEFATRGLFIVTQTQFAQYPTATGVITWNQVSRHEHVGFANK